MRVLLSYSDFAPASLAVMNIKGFALADPTLKDRVAIRTLQSHVSEDPDAYVERVVAAARELRPDVVGLSVYIWSRHRMYEATRRLRALLPETFVIWGGPDVSDEEYAAELLKDHPGVDVVVRDEGEQTFRRLLHHRLGDGPALDQIKGITFRDAAAANAAKSTGEVDYLDNLDEIPSLLDSDELDYSKVDAIALETFRGCYMGCNYCYWGGTVRRAFSDDRVFSDLGRIMALPNIKNVWFFDSMFGYKKNTAKALLRFIIARKRPDLSVTFFPNLDFLDDELCSLFKEANVYIETGIQTTNDEAYETLNRSWDRPFLDKKIGMLKKHGLHSNAQQLILGLPNDSIRGFRASVDYAFATRPEALQIFPFLVLPRTGFWRRRAEFELQFDGQLRIVWSSKTFPEGDMIKGGMIMVGAKWYDKFPGLAQQVVRMLGVPASELFEQIGSAFSNDVWGLPPIPENYGKLRGQLLLQAFPEDDERYLVVEVVRRVIGYHHAGRGLDELIDELIRFEEYLNFQEAIDASSAPEERVEEAVREWRDHPRASPVLSARYNIFDPAKWVDLSPASPPEPVKFIAYPLPAPRDFFKKDRPRWRVVVFNKNAPLPELSAV